MPRMVRIVFIGLFILALAAFAALEYVNRVVLPVQVKGWAESSLTQMLGRKVTIGGITIHPWHGILIRDVAVQEDARYGPEPFLRIERISGGVLYLPLFRDRKVIIPVLRIVRPRCRVLQDADGIWNVQSLRHGSLFLGGGTPSNFQVIVPRVVVADGELTLQVKRPGSLMKLHFKPLDIQVGLGLPSYVRCEIATELSTSPPTHLELEGTIDLKNHRFQVKNRTLLPLATLPQYVPPELAKSFPALEGLATCGVELSGAPAGPYHLKGSLQTKDLRWKYPLPKNLQALQGQGDLRVSAEGDLSSFEPAELIKRLSGTVSLNPTTLGPLPYIGELRGLTGYILFDSNGIRTQQLKAILPTGHPITLEAAMASDDKKTISCRANTELSLDQLTTLPLELQLLAHVTKLRGGVILEAQATGALLPVFSFRPTLTATVNHVAFELPQQGSLQEGRGTFRLQPDLITVTDLKGTFRDQPFEINGTLVNFTQPEIDARLSWGPLQMESQLSVDGDRAEIHAVAGRYQDVAFRIFGEINGWKKEPVGNLYGETSFSCETLPRLLPKPPPWLAGLKGEVKTRWLLQGPLYQPKTLDFDLKANAADLKFQDIPFVQVALEASRKEGHITLSQLKADTAQGTVSLKGEALPNDSKVPWKGVLSLEHLELSDLAAYLHWKSKDLSGRLSLEAQAQGEGADLSAIDGLGTIRVEGGRIVEFPFLGGFADLLKLPTLRTIVFETANGSFNLQKGQLRAENLLLTARQASVTITGSGGFLQGLDSPIDWHILPTLSSELIPQESRSKIGKVIAQGASYLVGEIRVTGTWKSPKQTFIPKPITQILNEQLLNLKDALKDLF